MLLAHTTRRHLCSWPRPARRFELESAAQRVLFRGSFATQRRGGALANTADLYIKNTSNTGIVQWGGRLLTMLEVRGGRRRAGAGRVARTRAP